tara:strand:- start:1202 stop:1912 length:711 start_codon:yes stop_codon:yes gene_type:complete
MTSALVVLSGGQDSTTCLFWAKQLYSEVHALIFDYGQRHAVEIESAVAVAQMAHINSYEVLPLGETILAGTSPLTDPTAEVEEYETSEDLPGGIEKTFVPGRNILFLTIAANRAALLKCNALVTGVCEEDFGGYPDCRMAFIAEMEAALNEGIWGVSRNNSFKHLSIETPLMRLSKRQTVELANRIDGCMDALAHTHTCYKGERPPCMKCHACHLRQRGFDDAGIPDPLLVRYGIA